jgi:hypothetical protein
VIDLPADTDSDPPTPPIAVTTAFEIRCLILVVAIGMFALAMWIG